jgi:hypothetical protein
VPGPAVGPSGVALAQGRPRLPWTKSSRGTKRQPFLPPTRCRWSSLRERGHRRRPRRRAAHDTASGPF